MTRPLHFSEYRQIGELAGPREIGRDFEQEARPCGFPSPPFGGFGFVLST
jgi:hypothetical protein